MKKTSRKRGSIILLIIVSIILLTAVVLIRQHNSKKCYSLYGDGYAMGTDSKPIVIGNTCDE